MKKVLKNTIILIFLPIFSFGLFLPFRQNSAQTDTIYEPLVELPGIPSSIDTAPSAGNPCPFGDYLNVMIKLIIGIAAVLAMVMITMGGIEYLTSELISGKAAGKETIEHAILGLLIALGAWLILNTINPKLLDACLKIPMATIVIEGPDAGDGTVDPDCGTGAEKYAVGSVSLEVSSAVAKIEQGWELSEFQIFKNNRMAIILKKGSVTDPSSLISISPGLNDYAPIGTGGIGDGKTPSGNWKIIDIEYIPNQAQCSETGSNMGAAFWRLNPMTSGERGIGMHGNKAGPLGATNGCIRLKNADILALQPYVKRGTPVKIQN